MPPTKRNPAVGRGGAPVNEKAGELYEPESSEKAGANQHLSVTVGLTEIGTIRESRNKVEAFDSSGRPIGVFAKREAAQVAIWENWRARQGGAP